MVSDHGHSLTLIMTNGGMRQSEARNQRWRDVPPLTNKQGRRFVRLDVRRTLRPYSPGQECESHSPGATALKEAL
jgi:hypothetical protein